jgi:hypothetical protein
MRLANPQTRFLLRASVCVIGMLVLWQVALTGPLLMLLRATAEVPLLALGCSAEQEVSGDWDFRVRADGSGQPGLRIRAVEFTVPRADMIVFTFSLPLYWALILAVPERRVRDWIRGTAVVAMVEALSLAVFIEIASSNMQAHMHPGAEGVKGLAGWAREWGDYMVVNVVPFAAPVLAAISMHAELRARIFSREAALGPQRLRPGPKIISA